MAEKAMKKVLRQNPWKHPLLLAAIPLVAVAAAAESLHAPEVAVFVLSAMAIVPLAGLIGRATEELSLYMRPAAGAFLNATFGNAAELIIALLALKEGLVKVVQASITGSILGNLLFILGLSMVIGGFRHRTQRFSSRSAGVHTTMLLIAAIGLVLPALFTYFIPGGNIHDLSVTFSVILLATYLLGLLFIFRTHSTLFNPEKEAGEKPVWRRWEALAMLVLAAALTGVASEILVGAVEPAAKSLGLGDLFIGVIIVAMVGNAAEHSTAIMFAWKNRMDVAVEIAASSSSQVALFVAPVAVLAGLWMGNFMPLDFEPFEVASLLLSLLVVNLVANDGECNWYEGVMLLAVYAMIGVLFFFHP